LDTEQRKQLKTWQDSGDVIDAQNFLLQQFNKLHGFAQAEIDTTGGKLKVLNRNYEEGQASLGKYFAEFKLTFLETTKQAYDFLSGTFQPELDTLKGIYDKHKATLDDLSKFILGTVVVAFMTLTKAVKALTDTLLPQIDKFLTWMDKADALIKIVDKATDHFKFLRDMVKDVYDWIDKLWGTIDKFASKFGINISDLWGKISAANSFITGGYLVFAGGTNFAPGGLAVVGERGPEVVNLPRGSQVYPTGSSPMQITQNNNIYNQVDFTAAIREIGWMIRR